MTEPSRGGLHFHVSKLLVAAVIAATAATGALVVTVLIDMPPPNPPPPGPNGLPPPPPSLQPLAVFPIVTGLFVLSWLAVLVVFARDQILRQLRRQQTAPVDREEIRRIVEQEIGALGERLEALTTEYGERRETDGYLNGMRAATAGESPEPTPNVRSFRRPPPPR
jgi:hypothetical protein